jgi:hypothetical protein
MNTLFESIRKFYMDGYGVNRKHYTDRDLAHLVKAKMLSQEEMDEIVREKLERDNPPQGTPQPDVPRQEADVPEHPEQEVVTDAGV